MQDRYVGDVGDFVKLAILRALQPGHRLGVAWWLYPDERHNTDGRHISYLQRPSEWRALDPDLFDGLARIVASGDRRVSALQNAGFLTNTVFHDETIPTEGTPAKRRAARHAWLTRVQIAMTDRDLVFLDPDNGLEPAGFSLGALSGGKCISLAQLSALAAPSKTLIVYHHQTRRKGGHLAELRYWADMLLSIGFNTVDAIRSRPYSPRAFFLLNASPELRERSAQLVAHWNGLLSWHQNALSPSTLGSELSDGPA